MYHNVKHIYIALMQDGKVADVYATPLNEYGEQTVLVSDNTGVNAYVGFPFITWYGEIQVRCYALVY